MSGENKRGFFLQSVVDYCLENKLKLTRLAEDWVLLIEGSDFMLRLISYDLGLNDSAVHRIVNDKFATAVVLNAAGLPTLDHDIVVHPDLKAYSSQTSAFETATALFDRYGRDVVVKPLSESGGIDVCRVTTQAELEAQTLGLLSKYRCFAVTPFVDIRAESRFYFLQDRLVLSYSKTAGSGDFRMNLSAGARVAFGISDDTEAYALACQAWSALGLRFGCIDVARSGQNDLFVLEANSGVMLNEVAKWADALDHPTDLRQIYFDALDLRIAEIRSADG